MSIYEELWQTANCDIGMARADIPYKPLEWTITETRPVKKPRRYSPSPLAGYGYTRRKER